MAYPVPPGVILDDFNLKSCAQKLLPARRPHGVVAVLGRRQRAVGDLDRTHHLGPGVREVVAPAVPVLDPLQSEGGSHAIPVDDAWLTHDLRVDLRRWR